MTDPFFFTITLPKPSVMADPARALELFCGTLDSVFNQTNGNFEVIVACHDLPETKYNHDRRLTYLPCRLPIPSTALEKLNDKFAKRRLMAAEIRRRGGGYMFHVDYDDRVHRDICHYVLSYGNKNGYYIEKGYIFDFASKKIKNYPFLPVQCSLHKTCGTTTIIRFSVDDLPLSIEDQKTRRFDLYCQDHHLWVERAAAEGRPLQELPFRAAVWVINSGLNLSVLLGFSGLRRYAPNLISRWREPTWFERTEFQLPNGASCEL